MRVRSFACAWIFRSDASLKDKLAAVRGPVSRHAASTLLWNVDDVKFVVGGEIESQSGPIHREGKTSDTSSHGYSAIQLPSPLMEK